MKGIIFTVLNDMIEEQLGLETWDKLLETIQPPSKGIYNAASTYTDEELFSLIGELSNITGERVDTLIHTFGKYAFKKLAQLYPIFLEGKDLKSFLKSVDNVIHVEVRKLYPDAELPQFEYEDLGGDNLSMIYKSPRKLCHLAEGLIEGAALHFEQPVTINQPLCYHKGNEYCRIEIQTT